MSALDGSLSLDWETLCDEGYPGGGARPSLWVAVPVREGFDKVLGESRIKSALESSMNSSGA